MFEFEIICTDNTGDSYPYGLIQIKANNDDEASEKASEYVNSLNRAQCDISYSYQRMT